LARTGSGRRAARRRGGRRRPAARRTGLRGLAAGLALVGFAGGFATAAWLVRVDRTVVARFEGGRFQVPSRVFSAPIILYPGLDYRRIDLRGTLQRLGYREAAGPSDLEPGRYLWGPHRIRIHVRAFEHPTRPEPAHDVVLRVRGSTIEEIRELPRGSERGAVLLEPEPIGAFYGAEREQRDLVAIGEVPEHLVQAVLAIEDQHFESHPGLDFRRIVGAALANLRSGRITQGASTLTQQLVKNFFLTPERTFRRKLREAVMAVIVELRYEKPAILEAYLNEIYLGQRGGTAVHGVGEAAHFYFGKDVRELSVDESALLAAIIQSPGGHSPYRDPERATQRRNLVLDLMRRQERLSEEQWLAARERPLSLAAVTPDPRDARYFLDLLRRQLEASYPEDVLTSEGLAIYSTLDLRHQRIAAEALREGLADLERRYPKLTSGDPTAALQGCLIALRPQTGELLALVGGRDYRISQFDRCTQARRQPGSVFKPFVYIAALEPSGGNGPEITLASFLDDSPLEVRTPSGPWRPTNYDKRFRESVPVREALERSLNVATARLAQRVGLRRVADVAHRLGIESELPVVPSLALGAVEVSPVEIARAYATIASGGVRPSVRTIEDLVDSFGTALERRAFELERVIDPGTAYLATSLLEGVAERGTARGIRNGGLRGPVAAKTGTSDSERDLWFVGFTPELVAVVWIGFDSPRSVGVPASVGALPVWRRFVEGVTGGWVRGRFPRPASVERVAVDPGSGARALSGCPQRREEFFLEGTAPDATCPSGIRPGGDDDGGGFLDWLRRHL